MTLTSTSVAMARSLMGSLVCSGRLYTIVVTPFFRSPDTSTASLRPPSRSSGHTPLFPSHCRKQGTDWKCWIYQFICDLRKLLIPWAWSSL
jgi:hypothetical protein